MSSKQKNQRVVKCKCTKCNKEFEATFTNVYKGRYRSCGCTRHKIGPDNYKWKGHGEISLSVFKSLQRGAKLRNLSFEVDLPYLWQLFLSQNRRCALSNVEIHFTVSRLLSAGNASLDRIDASKGYIEGNLQWVHVDVNFMKQSMTNDSFLHWIKTIYEFKHK